LISLVLPGAALVRAIRWRTRALIKLDLPTFERPTRATCGTPSRGTPATDAALVTNSAEWILNGPRSSVSGLRSRDVLSRFD
jgi:hypothetical protein